MFPTPSPENKEPNLRFNSYQIFHLSQIIMYQWLNPYAAFAQPVFALYNKILNHILLSKKILLFGERKCEKQRSIRMHKTVTMIILSQLLTYRFSPAQSLKRHRRFGDTHSSYKKNLTSEKNNINRRQRSGEKKEKTCLDAVPGVGNCERSVLLQYVEDDSGDRLCLLRRRFQLDRLHLGLRLLRHHPDCCPKHLGTASLEFG